MDCLSAVIGNTDTQMTNTHKHSVSERVLNKYAGGKYLESRVSAVLNKYLEGTIYKFESSSKILAKLFEDFVPEGEDILYVGNTWSKKKNHTGWRPDGVVTNTLNGKSICIECKNQQSSTGHDTKGGNAHERIGRYCLPGILQRMREICNIKAPYIPMWAVIGGDITMDMRHISELRIMFDTEHTKGNLFLWRDMENDNAIIEHFREHIEPLLR